MERVEPIRGLAACLPISDLPLGEVGPPLDPHHESWDRLAGWEDPLASRGGYRRPSWKTRVDHQGAPAVEWQDNPTASRSLVIGEPTWRDYSLECRVRQLASAAGSTYDEPGNNASRAGLVFRMETVRRYYAFCIENQARLVLYRRTDDEWRVLAAQETPVGDRTVTLHAFLDGDGIRAECPEMGVSFLATDAAVRAGLAGFRALGHCLLFDLRVFMTPSQKRLNGCLRQASADRTARLSASLPDEEEAGVLDLGTGVEIVASRDFRSIGRNDLLLSTPQGLVARTWEGETLWEVREPVRFIVFSSDPVDGGRRIYGLAGERRRQEQSSVVGKPSLRVVADEVVAIHGPTGRIEARAAIPRGSHEEAMLNYDLSFETGRLSGPRSEDIVLREWRKDCGGGGRNLWAFDSALRPLWRATVDPPYGHHNAVHCFDVDGDGRDEVIAGGSLIANGEVRWVHDRADEMRRVTGAGHYDAALVGRFADDMETDPVLFLMGGSAGVYVVDALTGRTRAFHRVGHAQWGMVCRVRDDVPGLQVMAGTRWENYGILTLFSGRGERLWSFQPDYLLQGTCPVQWTRQGAQHIWVNTSARGMGLYDGEGRLVKPLESLRGLYAGRHKLPAQALRRDPAGPDLLGLNVDGRLHLFGPRGG